MNGILENINNFKKNRLFKSILMITSGTAFAQLLTILLSPIITRIYSPSEYGLFILYSAIISIISIGSLKYELSIPICSNDKKAINILTLCIIILLIYVTFMSIILYFAGEWFLSLFGGQELLVYKYFIPLGILLISLLGISKQWSFRERNYKAISKATINQSIAGNSAKLILGLYNFGGAGLIIGTIISGSMGVQTLSKTLFSNKRYLWKEVNKKNILWGLNRYKSFPLYQMPSIFLMNAGMHIPLIFISAIYGTKVAGLYGLAVSITMLPMNLIGNSVADVFYSESASMGRNSPKLIKELSKKLLIKLILIGIVPLLILVLWAPFLFSIVFGAEWHDAGIYARIISFILFTRLIFTPISRVYEVFERQKEKLYLSLVTTSCIIIIFALASYLKLNSYYAIVLYTLVISIMNFITYLSAQRIINLEIKREKNLTGIRD